MNPNEWKAQPYAKIIFGMELTSCLLVYTRQFQSDQSIGGDLLRNKQGLKEYSECALASIPYSRVAAILTADPICQNVYQNQAIKIIARKCSRDKCTLNSKNL